MTKHTAADELGDRVARPAERPVGVVGQKVVHRVDVDAGRIVVEPDLSVSGHADVIAIGDMVAVRGKPSFPGLAPVAMQMGRHAARLVRARLRGRQVGDFVYRDKGNLATIGRAQAAASSSDFGTPSP